jgi:15-cis-phytoene desaturase
MSAPIAEILTSDEDLSITGLRMKDGSVVTADEYVSAMPVDVFKRLLPASWSTQVG